MYAFAGGRRDIADDATAEAFARALEHAARILDPVPWLYRTAFRVAAAELKRPRHVDEPFDPPVVEHRDTDLARSLAKLSPMQRASIYLHYIADLPVRDVANLMGTSGAAVKVHLFRGRERLRSLLGEEADSDE
ncbi:MAG: RNA polymerase sigma factor [Actinomycetota bacterium]